MDGGVVGGYETTVSWTIPSSTQVHSYIMAETMSISKE